MQIAAAIRIASVAMALASRSEWTVRARAAASAYAPPEPIPIRPSSGSMTSPVPETMNECSRSATARSASSRRSTRSVRQSLASSTAVLGELGLEPGEERERVGGRAGESGHDTAVVELAHLAGARLDDRLADRHLPVAGQRHLAAVADRHDRGGVERGYRFGRHETGITGLIVRGRA